ncbi:MAG: TlpA family protein disulfide reductase [Phycisphaerae bacterium]|nr:TlpA family protein disulfide reductase [Phycisphaerae bacterium]
MLTSINPSNSRVTRGTVLCLLAVSLLTYSLPTLCYSRDILLTMTTSFLSGAALPPTRTAAREVQLEDILHAWRERAERTRTVRCEWTETHSQSTSGFDQWSFYSPAFVQPREFEREFVTHKRQYSFQLTPESVWHRNSGVIWDSDTLQFLQRTYWSYYDSTLNASLFEKPERMRFITHLCPAVAFVGTGGYSEKWNTHVEPLIQHYRALDEALSLISQGSLKLISERGLVAGHECVRLDLERERESLTYWVDVTSKAFLIRRYEQIDRDTGRPLSRTDIRYREQTKANWSISGWSFESSYDESGKPKESFAAEVRTLSVNGEVEPKAKLIEMPVGTDVQDYRTGELSRYLIVPGGAKRKITSDDMKYGSPTYQELLSSEPGKATPSHFVAIYENLRGIRTAEPEQRDQLLAELKTYLADQPRPLYRHVKLLERTALRLLRSEEPESAIRMCNEFAKLSDVFSRVLLPMAEELTGELRRTHLVGSPLVLTGKTVDGGDFDWDSYRGKVVLVDFWYAGCVPCVQEMPHIQQLYQRYRDSGFEVVGISVDTDVKKLKKYIAKVKIPWKTIHEPERAKSSNIARYNIGAYPTAILVDRQGKVVSLEARGKKLEELLKKLLGD